MIIKASYTKHPSCYLCHITWQRCGSLWEEVCLVSKCRTLKSRGRVGWLDNRHSETLEGGEDHRQGLRRWFFAVPLFPMDAFSASNLLFALNMMNWIPSSGLPMKPRILLWVTNLPYGVQLNGVLLFYSLLVLNVFKLPDSWHVSAPGMC